jgi:hypothetical protein
MLYLGWEDTGEVDADAPGPWTELVVLRPGLVLMDADASRSEVYHALKHLLPEGTPVLVAPLADAPKMSRMAEGTTAWVSDRATSAGSS